MEITIVDEVVEQLKGLPHDMQRRVLEFTRALAVSVPRGAAGRRLMQFAGTISPQDAEEIREAVEQGCEQVDEDGW